MINNICSEFLNAEILNLKSCLFVAPLGSYYMPYFVQIIVKTAVVCLPVATLVHVMKGFGSPSDSQTSLAVLSAGKDTVLM